MGTEARGKSSDKVASATNNNGKCHSSDESKCQLYTELDHGGSFIEVQIMAFLMWLTGSNPSFTGGLGIFATVLAVVGVVFGVFLAVTPSPVECEAFELGPMPAFEGALAANNKLQTLEKLFDGKINGSESIAIKDGHLYTGTAYGSLIDITMATGKARILVKQLGKPPCEGAEDAATCGRPAGLRFGPDGFLYTADNYLGIWKVNVNTGGVENLVPARRVIDGHRLKYFNDLDIGTNGVVYFTDSSYKWSPSQSCYVNWENKPFGRLLSYDPKTKTTSVLLKGLHNANGVQLANDESFLLVAETARMRITRYWLKGEKAGQSDIFADNLPGSPENIRPSSSGGWWVAFGTVRKPDQWSVWDSLAKYPDIRNMIAKVLDCDQIDQFGRNYGLVAHLDNNGKITSSLQDPLGTTVTAASQVTDDQGALYIAGPSLSFIGKL